MANEIYIMELVNKLANKRYSYDIMKLNKLLYFAYAKGEGKQFDSLTFEAWKNGPVVKSLRNDIVHNFYASITNYVNYYRSNGKSKISLDEGEGKVLDEVIDLFGDFESYQLSNLTHNDVFSREEKNSKTPWKRANPYETECQKEIDKKEIRKFYSSEWFSSVQKNKNKIKEMLS